MYHVVSTLGQRWTWIGNVESDQGPAADAAAQGEQHRIIPAAASRWRVADLVERMTAEAAAELRAAAEARAAGRPYP